MYGTPQGVDQNAQPIPFSELIATSHGYEVVAQIEAPDGRVLAWGFAITGGSVRVDRSAQYRRSVGINVKPYGGAGFVDVSGAAGLTQAQRDEIMSSLVPAKPSDTMAPYGNQVRLWYGIPVPGFYNAFLQNNVYYWGLGVFRIAEASISDDAVPTLSITGYDSSRTISRNRLTQPWLVAAGQNYGDAIIALAKDRLPSLRYREHGIQALTPAIVVDPEQDPWAVLTEWASAIGYEVFFDAEGWLVLQPEPNPALHPVDWVYGDGGVHNNALVLSVDRTMNDEPGYNGVVMTSESSTLPAPLRSEVWDENPSSPTYAPGPYGRVPKFVSNPYVADQAQCDAAAYAELQRSIGGTEKVDMAVMPNPAHEVGDILRVVRPLSKTDQTTVLESFEFPLGAEPMRLSCRERRSLA